MKIFIKPKSLIYLPTWRCHDDIREENISSTDNAKILGQGGLFHNLY